LGKEAQDLLRADVPPTWLPPWLTLSPL
jgi:hypothetical protein